MNADDKKARANALFREKQQQDGGEAVTEYQTQQKATREKTERLRAQRLARDATEAAKPAEEAQETQGEGQPGIISVEQIKAARRLLGWTQSQLSRNSGVSENTIQRYEKGSRRALGRTLVKIQRAFEAAGVEFINGEPRDVRMRTAPIAISVEELNASNDE